MFQVAIGITFAHTGGMCDHVLNERIYQAMIFKEGGDEENNGFIDNLYNADAKYSKEEFIEEMKEPRNSWIFD